ncbi:hypothetical protein HW130_27350 [Streptomyces sp. PKU-EA00015]|uniref:ferric reductase-like transmembrane domain-containing protein n=1 Tax=Streptomyces sp. PKU-EA00015 TaxID=2748326 RepID=UPI0015A25FB6|nr:ferric reductase-like transmembrane domain-containing protein [Streptomyces sp. PKU-EA00015]NWF29933.1 hypothetical protein [Streptomyces sp. PKU-EA00015]
MNPRLKQRLSPGPEPGLGRPVQGGLYTAALILIPVLAIGGSDSFRAALDFTTGVLSLVSLTASVAWGLIATDRVLLSPRHRLLAQGIHRTTAVASLGFLLLHATVKVSLGHVAVIGALIPFGLGVTGTSALIGFGSLAGLLMVVAATTGALRSALAGNVRVAGRWRPLHMLAYPAWCFALVHGLYAGRPAATWVVTMYCLALLGVAAAVSVRLLPRPVQRRVAARIMSLTGVGDGGPPTADEQAQRDPIMSPLPGAGGLNGTGRSPVSAGMDRMDRMDRANGIPSQRPYEQDFQTPLEQARAQPPRLAAPSPQLYEAPPPPDAEPTVVPSGSGTGRGPGMAAAYRAVSLAADAAAPLAERVPMTEEIPVVSETGPRPGTWPTPSPPPPAQAVRPEPASPLYDTPPPPLFDSAPSYDTPPPPPFDPAPSYDTPPPPLFDPAPSYDTPPAYGATTPSYGSTAAYDTPGAYDTTAASYGVGGADEAASPPPYDDRSAYGIGGPAAYDETAPMPGPLFQPPAGEPWNAPAGERP